jgi:uracil-DNA glycosylase
MTRFELHVQTWQDCTACDLHERRKRVVFNRGSIPCDFMFLGEAPGPSEDVIGKPFVGPAGKLLDDIVADSIPPHIRCTFTNLVCCIPLNENSTKFEEPPKEAVKACRPRLIEFVRIAKPKVIVLVGACAKKYVTGQAEFCTEEEDMCPPWIGRNQFIQFVEIVHPAAILRANVASQGLAIQRCKVRLANAVQEASQAGLLTKPVKPGTLASRNR